MGHLLSQGNEQHYLCKQAGSLALVQKDAAAPQRKCHSVETRQQVVLPVNHTDALP